MDDKLFKILVINELVYHIRIKSLNTHDIFTVFYKIKYEREKKSKVTYTTERRDEQTNKTKTKEIGKGRGQESWKQRWFRRKTNTVS